MTNKKATEPDVAIESVDRVEYVEDGVLRARYFDENGLQDIPIDSAPGRDQDA